MSSGTISTLCLTAHHEPCHGTVRRARPGVLPGIVTIHHPNPDPGESLQHETIPCLCPCHKAGANHPALPPGQQPTT